MAILRELNEVEEGRPNKEQLILNYIRDNKNQTPTQIAKALNVSRPTVYKYLKKFYLSSNKIVFKENIQWEAGIIISMC